MSPVSITLEPDLGSTLSLRNAVVRKTENDLNGGLIPIMLRKEANFLSRRLFTMNPLFIKAESVRFTLAILLATVLLQISSGNARSDVVLYNNGVTNIDTPYWSDVSNGQLLADDFALTGDALLSEISWSGVYGGISPLQTDFFEIKILQDVDPSDEVRFLTVHAIQTSDVNRVDSGSNFGSLDIFNYTADVSSLDIMLDGDEIYWLSIYNETPVSSGGNAGWAWSAEDNSGSMASMNPTRPWSTFASSTDFELLGSFSAIPEPSGLVLSTAFVAIFITRRRRGE